MARFASAEVRHPSTFLQGSSGLGFGHEKLGQPVGRTGAWWPYRPEMHPWKVAIFQPSLLRRYVTVVFRRVQEGVEGESSQIFVSFMWTWDQSWSGPLSSIVFNWWLYHHDILVLHHVPFAKCNRWLFDHAGSAWMLVCQRDCCQSLQPGNRQRRSVPWIEEWPCATCWSMFAKLGFERTSLKYLCCSRPFWKFACSFFQAAFRSYFLKANLRKRQPKQVATDSTKRSFWGILKVP